MPNCPTCGKHCDTEQGVKIHHTTIHDESLVQNTWECFVCDDEFERPESQINNKERPFCSNECYGKWLKSQDKKDHPNWSGNLIVVNCDNCSSECEKYKHKVEEQENVFCSRECQITYRSEHYTDRPYVRTESITVTCDECSTEFKRNPSYVEASDKQFCSNNCRANWLSENWSGEDSPLWKGGPVFYYGENWLSQRRKAIQRDNEQCQECGLTREQHYENHGSDLEVHHKTPIRTFEDTAEANELSNLITLCKPCHIEVEHS